MAIKQFLDVLWNGRRPKQPERDTIPFPNLIQIGQQRVGQRILWKPIPKNLRYFARTPYARRAINAIKNPIAMLEWEIVPMPGVKTSPELERQIEVANRCLESPNQDDDFRSFREQVIEDILVGAGAIEKQPSGDALRPLWMWPVDGLSIQMYPGWGGGKNEARYCQSVGYGSYTGGGPTVMLRDDELIYLRPNPSTATPFGFGPLEVAFNTISRQLGVADFSGNVASNARPSILLDMGKGADAQALAAFRSYWQTDIEGQGKVPIVATDGGEVQKLYPDGDDALFLKYQEFLKVELATAFDLSPQNLGVERDVNRNTSEVAAERDRDQAIKPWAILFAAHITRGALHRGLGFYQLMLRFPGLDPSDEDVNSQVFEREFRSNAITPDEYREKRGMAPMDGDWGDKTWADVQIAMAAARSAATVLDPDIDSQTPTDQKRAKPAATTKGASK
jgi:hypothetical protein